MTESNIFPQVGETWKLIPMPDNDYDWINVLILEVVNNADGTKTFLSAKIITTELPVNYTGSNIEIPYSSSSGISSPFVIYTEEPRKFDIGYFQQKCGKLEKEHFERAFNYYIDYNKTVEFKHGKKN